MPTVTITGGTGLIGTAISKALLAKDYDVIILTRNKSRRNTSKEEQVAKSDHLKYAEWDPEEKSIDENAIISADYIIHLAGANVGSRRWTEKRKEEILKSRVDSSQLITDSLKKISNKVRAVISAGAIGWYGPDRPEGRPFVETDPPFKDFLGQTCFLWEQSLQPLTELGKRLVIFRQGIVLSEKGGALKEFLKPMKTGLATVLGDGKQIVSWIHIDDLVNLYIRAIENETMSGVYNAVSSAPVSNRQFVHTLAKVRGKFFIPARVPKFVLKTVLGEMSVEVLKSCTVSNEKVKANGFVYKFDDLNSSLEDLFSKQ